MNKKHLRKIEWFIIIYDVFVVEFQLEFVVLLAPFWHYSHKNAK